MQPEPQEHPNKVHTENASSKPANTIQHGLSPTSPSADTQSPSVAVGETGPLPTNERSALYAALAASLHEPAGPSQTDKELNTPSPPVYNRITEYEKASTPPVRKRGGPAFEVIKKPRKPGDTRSPIAELPSEVLTHVLANLSPADLAAVAAVSKRFHALVTTPYAWRTAFARYFPGRDSLDAAHGDDDDDAQEIMRTERRAFTRLTALASWRSEYILRTRLLRSLGRAKPVRTLATGAARSGQSHTAPPFIMYHSRLTTTVNHLHATFGSGFSKSLPRFIHGADDVGTASASDPQTGKVDNWGFSDPQFFLQFTERFPGDAQFGLGPGEVVGVPNVMDLSQPYGMIHGEGSPGGMAYYRSSDEMRGRYLTFSSALSEPGHGIPRIASTNEAICCVWIAKSSAIPQLTDGLIGLLTGSSLGVINAHSLGSGPSKHNRDQRFSKGEMTARWVLSPGVPIIAIVVDNEYSLKRQAQNRIWAVALNALGEAFYLTKFPKRPEVERGARMDDESHERLAWLAGRTTYWNIVEPSRRTAKPDPYADAAVDGSYSPCTSWNGMCLSTAQIAAETHEIEEFATRKPKHFQKFCAGWDMRRKLEVDFANDDGNNAGETLAVFECGLDGETPAVKRFTRCRFRDRSFLDASSTPPLTYASTEASTPPSLFGGSQVAHSNSTPGLNSGSLEMSLAREDLGGSITPRPMNEEWRLSNFTFGGMRGVRILTTTLDSSMFAVLTTSEDPLFGFSGTSAASSPYHTPMSPTTPVADPADIPGQRARLVAAGTATGSILIWDIRAPVAQTAEVVNSIEPVRVIFTDSPQISSLALSSLYLVHGGNDGVVQAWDPLASNMQPIRTLHSRFSLRARRQLAQAQASAQDVGINLFAAGAICLDPDPTVLRGMVALGTNLRYWSYSSSAADQYRSHKRRLRRSERGSNTGGERFLGTTRTNFKDYIANERHELEREKARHKKEKQRFAGRFGIELFNGEASEEEMIAYAEMLSQESLELENMRRASDTSDTGSNIVSSSGGSSTGEGALTPTRTSPPVLTSSPDQKSDDEVDADLAEAIRQSLATSPGQNPLNIPIRQAKQGKGRSTPSIKTPKIPSSPPVGPSRPGEMDDLDFAMQLSLAEEQSRQEAVKEDFPALSPSPASIGKGKGRAN